jgi:hypothetical protein
MLFFQGRGAGELSSDRKTDPKTDASQKRNHTETAGTAVALSVVLRRNREHAGFAPCMLELA